MEFYLHFHGVPEGFQVWNDESKKEDNIQNLFYSKGGPFKEPYFSVHCCEGQFFYSHIVPNLLNCGGRSGSYFGITFQSDTFCADIHWLKAWLEHCFAKQIYGKVIANDQFTQSSLQNFSELFRKQSAIFAEDFDKHIIDSDVDKSIINLKKSSFVVINPLDFKVQDVRELIKNYDTIIITEEEEPMASKKHKQAKLEAEKNADNLQKAIIDNQQKINAQENEIVKLRQFKDELEKSVRALETEKCEGEKAKKTLQEVKRLLSDVKVQPVPVSPPDPNHSHKSEQKWPLLSIIQIVLTFVVLCVVLVPHIFKFQETNISTVAVNTKSKICLKIQKRNVEINDSVNFGEIYEAIVIGNPDNFKEWRVDGFEKISSTPQNSTLKVVGDSIAVVSYCFGDEKITKHFKVIKQ